MTLRMLIVLFLGMPALGLAAPFDRLFTTPAERTHLEYLRQTSRPAAEPMSSNQSGDAEAIPQAALESLSIQGYVKRSDGKKGTVWINRQAVRESRETAVISNSGRIRSGEVELKVPTSDKAVRLKPGQVYVPATNVIRDYQGLTETSGGSANEAEGVVKIVR